MEGLKPVYPGETLSLAVEVVDKRVAFILPLTPICWPHIIARPISSTCSYVCAYERPPGGRPPLQVIQPLIIYSNVRTVSYLELEFETDWYR